jgi:hypothetical protein
MTASKTPSWNGRSCPSPTTSVRAEAVVAEAERLTIDAAGNGNAQASFSVISDRDLPTGTINPTGSGSITGTATDQSTLVASVGVSIFNGTAYWDGTGFNSTTEVFLQATTVNNFQNWSVQLPQTGSFTVHAQITDSAGNVTTLTQTVVLT